MRTAQKKTPIWQHNFVSITQLPTSEEKREEVANFQRPHFVGPFYIDQNKTHNFKKIK